MKLKTIIIALLILSCSGCSSLLIKSTKDQVKNECTTNKKHSFKFTYGQARFVIESYTFDNGHLITNKEYHTIDYPLTYSHG